MPRRPVHNGLFTDEHLIGGRCGVCGEHHFPVAGICPYCGSDDTARVELSEAGTLWGWTAVTAPPPGYEGDVPYGFGVVELPEGIRVISRVEESDPARLSFGMPLRFATVPLRADDDGTTVETYTFVPDEAT